MYFRKKTSGRRAYLQIVESRREGAAVRQQVIATLGRVEDLQASGQLERLLRSGARFAAKAIVVDAVAAGEATASAARRIGPALVFERLWEETGCRKVVEDLAGARKHDFALERAVFLTVLHRLLALSEQFFGPCLDMVASGYERPVPIFQQLAGGHPSGRDDVREVPAVAAQRRGSPGRARDRHQP